MFAVKTKIHIARALNRTLRLARGLFGRDMKARCRRGGLLWDLDLNEGIDLSIYLLGAYEPRTIRCYNRVIRPGDVVFDIGANIGAHTLHFADLVGPSGRVFAIEPTDFAIGKLRQNLSLNPAIASRVETRQLFLAADRAALAPVSIPSSWPVGNTQADLDPQHLGKHQSLAASTTMTADDFCVEVGCKRIDLVKIDVDGHEYPVLRGFSQALARFRPIILIELAPFIYEGDKAGEFDEFIRFLGELGYGFVEANTNQPLPNDAASLRRVIPAGTSVNALLTPKKSAV